MLTRLLHSTRMCKLRLETDLDVEHYNGYTKDINMFIDTYFTHVTKTKSLSDLHFTFLYKVV